MTALSGLVSHREALWIASAMTDVTRQVGGSLGTAVIGSLITSLFTSNVESGASAGDAFTAVVGVVGPASSLLLEHPDSTRAPVAANTAAMRQNFFGPP